jgi:hypothetical protein
VWRDQVRQYDNVEDLSETEAAYNSRAAIALHPQFVKAGVVHRLPRMKFFSREPSYPDAMPGRVFDPPRVRHTDVQYATFCCRLMNALQGEARLFATCEFFYSDIDRQWYV